jgi:hypothetical protein
MITYARRTLTGWFNAVLKAGLAIEAIDEPHADEATARSHPEVADTRIAPRIHPGRRMQFRRLGTLPNSETEAY